MKYIKSLIAFPLAWLFWLLGDVTYRVLELNDDSESWCAFWYRLYNGLMILSGDIQDWAGFDGKPWPWGHDWSRNE